MKTKRAGKRGRFGVATYPRPRTHGVIRRSVASKVGLDAGMHGPGRARDIDPHDEPVTAFSIGMYAIREFDGLYCLNDLHRAAGGKAKHQPADFLCRKRILNLIRELKASGKPQPAFVRTINTGAHLGSYACREITIAYAAWIGDAFHMAVDQVMWAAALRDKPASRQADAGTATPLRRPSDAVVVSPSDPQQVARFIQYSVPPSLLPDVVRISVDRMEQDAQADLWVKRAA
ncbi:KilA-N domain-containing protein [Burkholderia sp. Nafp2/4-1b]|uniref:KilA-N domain-containing protein n=1 Tax=Burkholderia sp. Nafp2/4-1b TaxID=2116686 RepID=UPI0013CF15E5|nr:KilA-N domain-containing protein [Burkholderia sp. Nafp2/4-1b]